jgi:electron transfer flavoprotein beta subunit
VIFVPFRYFLVSRVGRIKVHAVVCLKQVIDPEVPPHLFRIDPVEKKQIQGTQALVIGAFDEIAVEVALQLKEKAGGKVTIISIAETEGKQALHQALAMGADEAVLLSDPAFEDSDSFGKARILAAALNKLGEFDVVLCGRQAGDVELGLVGLFLAEEMDLPCINLAANMEPHDGQMQLKRPIEGGYEVLQVPRPFVATVTNDESNVPRYASVRGIRMAMRKEIPLWSAEDLGLDPAEIGPGAARIQMEELFIPERDVRCEFIAGESGAEKAERLAQRLRELKLI